MHRISENVNYLTGYLAEYRYEERSFLQRFDTSYWLSVLEKATSNRNCLNQGCRSHPFLKFSAPAPHRPSCLHRLVVLLLLIVLGVLIIVVVLLVLVLYFVLVVLLLLVLLLLLVVLLLVLFYSSSWSSSSLSSSSYSYSKKSKYNQI